MHFSFFTGIAHGWFTSHSVPKHAQDLIRNDPSVEGAARAAIFCGEAEIPKLAVTMECIYPETNMSPENGGFQ